MPNIHGLFSGRNDDDSGEDDSNNRFVGGISDRGGGRCVPLLDNTISCVQHVICVCVCVCVIRWEDDVGDGGISKHDQCKEASVGISTMFALAEHSSHAFLFSTPFQRVDFNT